MEAPDKWLYEYALIRFVPRIDRGEFLNIGLVMMCKRQKWLKGMILIDDKRILSAFPNTDLMLLKNQSGIFERTDLPDTNLPVEEKYRWLTAVKSAILQTSPSHPGIIHLPIEFKQNQDLPSTDVLEKEFTRLFSDLVFQ